MIDNQYTYLLVDFFCFLFPFLFSFHPRLRFIDNWRQFIGPNIITALFFIIWDIIFTNWGVWHFEAKYTLGYFFMGLPIEEYLFFFCIPYACVFSYHCFKVLFQLNKFEKEVQTFYFILSIVLLAIALSHLKQLYTSVTFILTSVFLLYLLKSKARFLTVFFFCYLFILIPFTLSNGVLTGSFFQRTVVHYNNNHNLGIRILTIPIEDTIYGLLMLLMNVFGYEYCIANKKNQSKI